MLLRDKVVVELPQRILSQTGLVIQPSDIDWMYGIGERNKPRNKGQAIIIKFGQLNKKISLRKLSSKEHIHWLTENLTSS